MSVRELEPSKRTVSELGVGDAAAIAAAWGLPETDRGGADRTSHFVVSFPQGTDPDAAERAGRAWAVALFDSGAYGDRWDYYTAFHKDTAYPHIHVVVGRRGLDEGQWLRVSSRGELTFDRLREVQVDVAAREGIALTGTTPLKGRGSVCAASNGFAHAERKCTAAVSVSCVDFARLPAGSSSAMRPAVCSAVQRLICARAASVSANDSTSASAPIFSRLFQRASISSIVCGIRMHKRSTVAPKGGVRCSATEKNMHCRLRKVKIAVHSDRIPMEAASDPSMVKSSRSP